MIDCFCIFLFGKPLAYLGRRCYNCGASGGTVRLPRWAIDAIRKNASWVGKRYYPDDEDRERAAEARTLRGMMTAFPGRRARRDKTTPGRWFVEQATGAGRSTGVMVEAADKAGALRAAKCRLPYITKTALRAKETKTP